MQDRYVGDIGDYFKYAFLRSVFPSERIGVAWYLFPDEEHNNDGKHTTYLDDSSAWRHLDSELFDTLYHIVRVQKKRNVSMIEKKRLLGNAVFASEKLAYNGKNARQWRYNWFARVHEALIDTTVVFADPDNGLRDDDRVLTGTKKNWKGIAISEAVALSHGKTGVIYHHNTRRKGGHDLENIYWLDRFKEMGIEATSVRFRRGSGRTFFILNPTALHFKNIESFCQLWKA